MKTLANLNQGVQPQYLKYDGSKLGALTLILTGSYPQRHFVTAGSPFCLLQSLRAILVFFCSIAAQTLFCLRLIHVLQSFSSLIAVCAIYAFVAIVVLEQKDSLWLALLRHPVSWPYLYHCLYHFSLVKRVRF